jgi:hypothetical protein
MYDLTDKNWQSKLPLQQDLIYTLPRKFKASIGMDGMARDIVAGIPEPHPDSHPCQPQITILTVGTAWVPWVPNLGAGWHEVTPSISRVFKNGQAAHNWTACPSNNAVNINDVYKLRGHSALNTVNLKFNMHSLVL